MAKLKPDYSFERGGRSLTAWLRELVSEDAAQRLAAGEALQAMRHAVPSVHTDLSDFEWGSRSAISDHTERFEVAVRDAVKAPGFDTHNFVRKLILFMMMLQEDWRRRMERDREARNAPNIYEDRLIQRLQAADNDADRIEVARRFMKWVCASFSRSVNRGNPEFANAESMSSSGFMASSVFDVLGDSLLVDRPGLHLMLADEQLRWDAARALARIGPPAVDFAGVFFSELDSQKSRNHFFDGAKALGSIGRDDPDVIDGLLKRLKSGPIAVRSGAAAALFHAAGTMAGRREIALDLLLGATHHSELAWSAIPSLAAVGHDREVALARILELAAARPPRWVDDKHYSDGKFDEVVVERGIALSSLRHFQGFADRVVPMLIDAIDTFEEFDPDHGYEGEHERVCNSLLHFGQQAAPAVPRLVRYLEEWLDKPEQDRDWPKSVFRLLAAIGPPAAAALPTLDRIRLLVMDDDDTPGELDPEEPLDAAILAIRPVL